MSARRRHVTFTKAAARDFDDIYLYGVTTWGTDRAQSYQDDIGRAIDQLADFPYIGESRDALRSGLRAWLVEHHVVYYTVTDDAIEVIRIFHKRRDARRLFRR